MAIQPVILCGGRGSRLWPLSRVDKPKQFIDIFDGENLFEMSIKRALEIKTDRNLLIVTSKDYEFLVRNSLIKLNVKAKILLEPVGKNTATAIYLSCKYANVNDHLLIMPSDHYMTHPKNFIKTIDQVLKQEIDNCWLLFGVRHKYFSSSFGYFQYKKSDNYLKDVVQFVEKPSDKAALNIQLSENFLCNSGIFLGKVDFIINSFNTFANDIASSCETTILNHKSEDFLINFDKKQFEKIPSLSIDYAILEYEKRIKCVEIDVGWNDVGTFDGLMGIAATNQENAIQINGVNKIFTNKDRLIATLGVENLTVIDSEDITLITKKENNKNIRSLVEYVSRCNPDYLKNKSFEDRPWGRFDILLDENNCKVKKLTIFPYKSLSLQYHNHRSEHWLVVKGIAEINLDGNIFELEAGNSIDIKKMVQHSVKNNQSENLIIIEIQMGDYFGEDDIVRIDDPYKR